MKSIRDWFKVCILTTLVALLFPGAIFAQTSPLNARIEGIDSQSFPQVKAYVSVTDSQGFSITGLEQSAFSVSEDMQPLSDFRITPFKNDDQPLAIVLVIDVSGSMAGSALSNSVAAAKDFIATLTPNDKAALIAFSTQPVVLQDLTSDHSLITQALDGLKAEGDTAHYDALIEAVNLLKNRSERRVIVSLTDGKETGISSFDFDQMINEVVRWSIPVYPIGFGGVDQEELGRLAKLTGGFAQVKPDSSALTAAFSTVLENLRQQYLIEFTSTLQADALEHNLDIAVSHQDGVALASRKFVATPGQVTISFSKFTEGQEISGNVLFEPDVIAPAPVVQLDIQIDGQHLTSVLAAPFSHVWDSSIIPEGNHDFVFTVTDAAGNVGSKTITLNVQPPIRIVPGLVEDSVISGEVLVTADVTAPAGIAKINFYVDGQQLAELTAPPYEILWDTTKVSPGYHFLKITGADVNSFSTEAQVRVNVEIQKSSNLLWVAAIVALAAAGILIPLAIRGNKSAKKGKASPATGFAGKETPIALKASLIEKEGMNPGAVWPLNNPETRLGRKRDENDIPLKGLQASRRQALIRLQPEGFVLILLSSENPMIVNGTPATGDTLLKNGDVLEAGESQFVFEIQA